LEDIARSPVRIDAVVARYAATHWIDSTATLWWLLSPGDWISLQWSVLTLPSRLCLHAILRPWRWIPEAIRQTQLADVPAPKQLTAARRAA
jgi:hypothetical protein